VAPVSVLSKILSEVSQINDLKLVRSLPTVECGLTTGLLILVVYVLVFVISIEATILLRQQGVTSLC